MEYSEKKIQFSGEDYLFFRKKKNRAILIAFIFEMAVSILPAAYYIVPSVFEDSGMDTFMIWFLTCIMYAILSGFLIFFVTRYNGDSKSGMKTHVEGTMFERNTNITTHIIGKRRRSHTYNFRIGKNNFKVDKKTYAKVENGDNIIIEISEYSGTVLNLKITNRLPK